MREIPLSSLRKWELLPAAVLILAVALRVAGLDYGLPAVFNGDEPHHVNVAVSFGRGSLNPGVFKYPTLWMYGLFAAYGLFFAGWSGLGFLHSAREFGELFVWEPGVFFLIGRLLAALLTLGAVHRIYRSGCLRGGKRAGLWAAGLAAVSPTLVDSAHAAKPDGLMVFLAAWAWWWALRYLEEGRERDFRLCGLAVGLAISTQYTAAPLMALVPAAWLARRWGSTGARPGYRELAVAVLAVPAAFLAGSPFIVLDWPAFWRSFQDNWTAYGGANAGRPAGWVPVWNIFTLLDPWLLGGLLLAFGALTLARSERPRAALLIAPTALAVLFFSLQAEGGWKRYLLGCLPAAALLTAAGVEAAGRAFRLSWSRPGARSAALAALLAPGALESWASDRELLLPDTRARAARWIGAHVPAGTRILSDQESESPKLAFSRAHARNLLERTSAAGHPRRRYYELMVSGHPGGGFELYQIYREPGELHSGPSHVAWSSEGRPVIDVRTGLDAARAAGMELVILTSFGADSGSGGALERFLRETREQGRLVASFWPLRGELKGPRIMIYRIAGAGA